MNEIKGHIELRNAWGNESAEEESKHLKEELNELKDWQERHTRVFCNDCRKEALYNVHTMDGLSLHSCEKHFDCWLGCRVTKRKVR